MAANKEELLPAEENSTEPHTIPALSGCSKTLWLAGQGLTDMHIEALHVKFTRITVYIDPEVSTHLQTWKGKAVDELIQDYDFFNELVRAPVEKFVKVVILKGPIRGTDYGKRLVSYIKERLLFDEKLGEAEEEELEQLVAFFQNFKELPVGSAVLHAIPSPSTFTVSVDGVTEAEPGTAHTVSGAAIVLSLLDIFLGENTQSPSTAASVAAGVAAWLK